MKGCAGAPRARPWACRPRRARRKVDERDDDERIENDGTQDGAVGTVKIHHIERAITLKASLPINMAGIMAKYLANIVRDAALPMARLRTTTPSPVPRRLAFSDVPIAYEARRGTDGAEVSLPARRDHERTVADVMVDTMVAWANQPPCVRHGRPFQPRVRRCHASGRSPAANSTYIGIRHEGAAAFAPLLCNGKLTDRPAAPSASPGRGRNKHVIKPEINKNSADGR